MRAELERRDGVGARGLGGEDDHGHVGRARAGLAEEIERVRSAQLGADDERVVDRIAFEAVLEGGGCGGEKLERGRAVGEKSFGGRAALRGGVEEQHARRGGGSGCSRRGGTRLMLRVDAAHEVGHAAEFRGVFVDAVHGSGAQGLDREFRLAVAADHYDRGGVAAGGEFAEHL